MNATTSLQVGQAKQMPHVISDTGGRNYVWGDIIQLRITTRWYVGAMEMRTVKSSLLSDVTSKVENCQIISLRIYVGQREPKHNCDKVCFHWEKNLQ